MFFDKHTVRIDFVSEEKLSTGSTMESLSNLKRKHCDVRYWERGVSNENNWYFPSAALLFCFHSQIIPKMYSWQY